MRITRATGKPPSQKQQDECEHDFYPVSVDETATVERCTACGFVQTVDHLARPADVSAGEDMPEDEAEAQHQHELRKAFAADMHTLVGNVMAYARQQCADDVQLLHSVMSTCHKITTMNFEKQFFAAAGAREDAMLMRGMTRQEMDDVLGNIHDQIGAEGGLQK